MTKRLMGWFLALILLTVGVMGALVYVTVGENFRAFRSEHTESHLGEIPHILSFYYEENGSWEGVESELQELGELLGMQAVLVTDDGEVRVSAEPFPNLNSNWAEKTVPIDLHHSTDKSQAGVLYLARNPEMRAADTLFFRQLLTSAGLTALGAIVLGLAISYFVARSFASPLERMRDATKDVVNGNFDVRVEGHERDEVGHLGLAFNQMAAEIGKLEAVRRDLVMNVSHDFRTPLTVVQGYLEGLRTGKILSLIHI